jgi:soluble lytic murein transglycosylase
MMIHRRSDRITRDHSCKFFGMIAAAALLAVTAAGGEARAQTLDALVTAYRSKPTPALKAKLLQYEQAHAKGTDGALARFALGAVEMEQRQYAESIRSMEKVGTKLPRLQDYIHYAIGTSALEVGNYDGAAHAFLQVTSAKPASPYLDMSVVRAARAQRLDGRNKDAIQTLRRYEKQVKGPLWSLEMGLALEAAGDPSGAAPFLQETWSVYPNTQAAAEASTALGRVEALLGDRYPRPGPDMLLTRADAWLEAPNYSRASEEYTALARMGTGLEADLARVRIGVTRFRERNFSGAYSYLDGLKVRHPSAEAERLYHIAMSARRLSRDKQFFDAVSELEKKHPQSLWTAQVLVEAGNFYLLSNGPEGDRYYRACAENFPDFERAPYCQWKVAWAAYLNRSPEAGKLLRDHVTRYPASTNVAGALYFLGRLAELANDHASARAFYARIPRVFPNYYYAGLAEEKLARPVFSRVHDAPAVVRFLDGVALPTRGRPEVFEPSSTSKVRVEKARLLSRAGLQDMAERELRFGGDTEPNRAVYGLELAEAAAKRGQVDQAVRYLKRYSTGYLALPVEDAPRRFWELLYPMPYRTTIVANSRTRNLDPYLIAGLIRQESEFNAKAVSRAKAYGLTQVLPSTGRQISTRVGIKRFTPGMLTQPEVNIKIGTYYLKLLLDQHSGLLEPTLASYNAGKSRVDRWMTWNDFREMAEFVETIPFTETRGYVQSVMSNAQMYRRLYGGHSAAIRSTGGDSPQKVSSQHTGARRSAP